MGKYGICRCTRNVGASYIIIADDGANRISGLNNAGTSINNSRSFNTALANTNLGGLAFGDNLIWVLDPSDNKFYAYERDGTYQDDRDIPFSGFGGVELACAYYNGAIYIAWTSDLDAYSVAV